MSERQTIPSPSDALFKKVMEHPIAAREFLEHYLPADIKSKLDLTQIKLEKESYVDEELKRSLSDVVFSVPMQGEEVFVYVLAEAQSSVDHWIAFRLWQYTFKLCERHKKNKNKLPLVIPIVLYHGKTKYNAPLNLWDLFTHPHIAKEIFNNGYHLIDLQAISEQEIIAKEHFGMLEYMFRNIHSKDMPKLWQQFLESFNHVLSADKAREYVYLKLFLYYTESKMSEEDHIQIADLIKQKVSPEDSEEIMRTMAQKWMEEGEIRGEARGEAKGQRQIIMKLLQNGMNKRDIASMIGLSVKELEALLEINSSSKIAS